MADNTRLNAGIGGDLYAADELSTVNGATAEEGLKVQRVKVGFGQDGELQDVETSHGLPVDSAALDVLRRIAQLLKPLQQITGNGSNRLSIDVNSGSIAIASGTVTTVSNVAASTLTNFANVWAFDQAKAMSRQAFNSGIRTRIS